MSRGKKDPSVNVNQQVKVTLEITGEDLDMTLYAMDEIRERIQTDHTSGFLKVSPQESYRYRVENLEHEIVYRNEQIQSMYRTIRKGREDWLDPEDAMEMARDMFNDGIRRSAFYE